MSKKYVLHKITKKEASYIALSYGPSLTGDCYCLVSKKGKMLERDGIIDIFKATVSGRTETETSFKRGVEACLFFKNQAKELEFDFKMPKMEDLVSGELNDKKLKYPEAETVSVSKTDAAFLLSEEANIFWEKIASTFDKLNNLKKDIADLAPSMEVSRDISNYEDREPKLDEYSADFEGIFSEETEEYPDEEAEEDDYERE